MGRPRACEQVMREASTRAEGSSICDNLKAWRSVVACLSTYFRLQSHILVIERHHQPPLDPQDKYVDHSPPYAPPRTSFHISLPPPTSLPRKKITRSQSPFQSFRHQDVSADHSTVAMLPFQLYTGLHCLPAETHDLHCNLRLGFVLW